MTKLSKIDYLHAILFETLPLMSYRKEVFFKTPMILTCPECQSQYKLDPEKLGAEGRTVRCVSCHHMWFQKPAAAAPTEAPSVTEALETILKQDDIAFEAVLSKTDENRKISSPTPIASQRHEKTPSLAVITHNPLGVNATAFGALVFCLCAFLTLAVIFSARNTIVHRWPQTALAYKTIGLNVTAPGEGLRLSEIAAEQQDTALMVEGKITNTTEHEIDYPALQVTLKNKRDIIVKEWILKTGAAKIASGEAAPVMLQLSDAPEDGASIDLRVKDE